jgi:uncharacterized protein (UPF0303 family)
VSVTEEEQAAAAALLPELEAHEVELRFTRFDEDVAWALGVLLVEAARAAGLPVAISVRRNGQRLFHAALPGAAADNDAWIERKSRVVDRFSKSSFRVGRECAAGGRSFEETFRLDPDTYAAHGGAFPVHVVGTGVVGTVAVSGLPQAQDHAFVVEHLRAYLLGVAEG